MMREVQVLVEVACVQGFQLLVSPAAGPSVESVGEAVSVYFLDVPLLPAETSGTGADLLVPLVPAELLPFII